MAQCRACCVDEAWERAQKRRLDIELQEVKESTNTMKEVLNEAVGLRQGDKIDADNDPSSMPWRHRKMR